jgi:Tfp pilus assembly PilM family ATPase
MLFDRFRRPGASTEARSTPLFLGVEFKGAEVHLARYERRDDRVFLLHEATRSIADKSVDEQAEVLRDAVAELRLPRFGQRIAVTSVGDDVAILRAVKMTVGQGSKRERAARYQAANAQKFNAWKLDDCIVKAAAVAGRDDVFLVAKALREPVRERVALLKRAGLTAWIQHRSFTLGRALPNAPAILDVGRTSSALYVYSTMVKGELEPLPVPISVNVAFGEIDITRAIMSARNVTIMEAEADMDAGLDESAMQEIDNLGSMLAGHVAQLRDEYSAEIGEIVLVGRLGRFEGVERHLSRHLVLPVSVASLDGLESEDYPREIVRARGADLAPTLGAALLYDEPDRARRLNFAGTDFEAFASLTLEDRKLRRALVAPLLAVAVVASAYVIEGVRDGDMAAQAAQAQADLKLARAEEQRVTGLSDNVKELVAVYNDLQAIRNSGADRARELFEIDSKLTALDVSSIKATTDGWTITGNARDHSDVGRVLQAVQTALPGIVAVIPSDAIRPEVHCRRAGDVASDRPWPEP